jgi:hypothetical protein
MVHLSAMLPALVKTERHLTLLSLLWLTMQILVYVQFGIKSSWDSTYYIEIATKLEHGMFPSGRELYYASYALVLASLHAFSLPYETAIIVQLMASFACLVCVYRLGSHLWSENAGLLAGILYVVWFKIHQWNFFLYTESLYTSFSVILFWWLFCKTENKKYWPAFAALLAFTFFLRPNSVCLLGGLVVYYWPQIKQYKWIVATLLLISIAGLNYMIKSYDLMGSYQKTEIIYPSISLGMALPNQLQVPNTRLPLLDLLLFAFYQPVYFLKLFGIKIFLFYSNAKPYFSHFHNTLIICYLTPLYAAFLVSLTRFTQKRELRALASMVFFQGIVVGLTSENWDGRFLIPVLPFVFLVAVGQTKSFLKNRKKRFT